MPKNSSRRSTTAGSPGSFKSSGRRASTPIARPRPRHALAAVGAHPVLGHPGKPGRVLGTWHDGPAVRRSTDDIEKRAGDVHGFAEDVEQRLARPEFHQSTAVPLV